MEIDVKTIRALIGLNVQCGYFVEDRLFARAMDILKVQRKILSQLAGINQDENTASGDRRLVEEAIEILIENEQGNAP